MRRKVVHFAVFLLCLGLGLVIGGTFFSFGKSVVNDIPSAAKERNNELHKLYEAALMSGESRMMDRFQCFEERYDWLSSRFVLNETDAYCITRDGIIYPPASQRFGDPLLRVRKEHPAWVRNNMPFVASVANRERATAYFYQHVSGR